MPYDPDFDPAADLLGEFPDLEQEQGQEYDGIGDINVSGEYNQPVAAMSGDGTSEGDQDQYFVTSDILVTRKRKRSDIPPAATGDARGHVYNTALPQPPSGGMNHAIDTAPQPRPTPESRGPTASGGPKRKRINTGRGPGRYPKGSKKSDFGGASSGPGLPPGLKAAKDLKSTWRELAEKRNAGPGARHGTGRVEKSSESKGAAEQTFSSVEPISEAPSESPAPLSFPLPSATPGSVRRGRPVGWRLGAGSYAVMRGETPPGTTKRSTKKVAATARTHKLRGRPPRSLALLAKEVFHSLRPKFNSYLCEWQGCQADLQNFETLQRHVAIVHGQSETCKWGNCTGSDGHSGSKKGKEDSSSSLTPATTLSAADGNAPPWPAVIFPTRDSLEAHMYAAHLQRIQWELGDGPRNTSDVACAADRGATAGWQTRGDLADPPPRYLFDGRSGRQVTPSVRGQSFETDEERRARRAHQREAYEELMRTAPDEPVWTRAQRAAIAEALEEKKRQLCEMEHYYDRVCAPSSEADQSVLAWRGLLVAMPEAPALTAAVGGGEE